jgi:hypothetical protein
LIKLKWGLPGDFTGGIMIFGIMFAIAVIEMYMLRALQGTGGLTAGSLSGGGGGAAAEHRRTEAKVGAPGSRCKRKGGQVRCEGEQDQG